MTDKLNEFDYLTPLTARENGISKWKFYKYIILPLKQVADEEARF